jgi:hypothetical protein
MASTTDLHIRAALDSGRYTVDCENRVVYRHVKHRLWLGDFS